MAFFIGAWYADLRSLAVFRVLLACYLLWDVYVRISLGKYDLAWYTSDPPERSYLLVEDTPHKAPLHQFWFTRGSLEFQYGTFALSAILAMCLGLGFACNAFTKLLLFLVTTHHQNTNFYTHDGSDAFVRHLLLWSIFLPIEDCWSWKSIIMRNNGETKKNDYNTRSNHLPYTISGIAVLGLLTQIVLMYLGTICHRTLDQKGGDLFYSDWLPPKLTAVHYALLDPFAARDNFLTRFLIATPVLTASLTFATIVVEGCVPLVLCWMLWQRRHYGALILCGLHAGLLLVLNLPTWQYVGMLTQVVWIPTPVWDGWLLQLNKNEKSEDDTAAAAYKKTDGDTTTSTDPTIHTPPQSSSSSSSPPPARPLRPNLLSRGVQCFFFAYMLYNWCGNRGWIPKHDRGDIGEALRLSQWWIMYGTVSSKGAFTHLIGRRRAAARNDDDNGATSTTSTTALQSIDLYEFLKTGQEVGPYPEYIVPHNMTDRYPSPRWERVLAQWASGKDRLGTKGKKFCATLCVLLNEDYPESPFESIDLIYQSVHALPPGSEYYYLEERRVGHVEHPQIMSVDCRNPSRRVPRVVPTQDLPEPVLAPRMKPPKKE